MARRTDRPDIASTDPDQGSSTVIQTLSVKLRGPLTRYFTNRRIPAHEVDDLVQEVFLRLSARELDRVERPESYVFATASNLLRDRHRHLTSRAAAGHVPYDDAVHGSLRPTLEPDRILLGTQLITSMVEALYELPERTRAVFSLYHFEELTQAQISDRLGMAIRTVERNLARANAHLLNRLDL